MKNGKPKLLRSCPPQRLVQIPKKGKKVESTVAVKQKNESWEGGGIIKLQI
jgi:hypothetical protein